MSEVKRTLDLDKPEDARHYILNFDWGLPNKPDYAIIEGGEEIYFDKMTDEQAVIIARAIYLGIQDKLMQKSQNRELH